MKKNIFLFLTLTAFSHFLTYSQDNPKKSKLDVVGIYESSEQLLFDKNYYAALEFLKVNAGPSLLNSDSLLYLKIKILSNLYLQDSKYTLDLDSSLSVFIVRVNRYSFPEIKYEEVVEINSSIALFKENDRLFYDSVRAVTNLEKLDFLPKIDDRISEYLGQVPNSYYKIELNDFQTKIRTVLHNAEVKRNKFVEDSTSRAFLKKMGKAVINIGYSIPSGGTGSFEGLKTNNDVLNFFNGKYSGTLGIQYSLNASLADLIFALYTSTRLRVSIDWSLFDGEYTVFNWSQDTLIKHVSGSTGYVTSNLTGPVTSLASLTLGTRIGPSVTFLLAKKIAISLYYSVRPGIQLLPAKYGYNGTDTSGNPALFIINPVIGNFNLSNEIGIKIRFFKSLFINPFYHFGKFNWQNDIQNQNNNQTIRSKASYPYTFIGIRIGI